MAFFRQFFRSPLRQFPRAVAFLLVVLFPVLAVAHPHVFVEARTKLIFDDQGNASEVEHVFRFDDAFSAYAMQGFDANGDGVYSRDELAELAKVNVDSMAEFGYFTFGDNSRIELDFDPVQDDYWLEVVTVPLESYWMMKPEDYQAIAEERAAGRSVDVPENVQLLELHFRLALKPPTDADSPITLDVYDPTYYVDFRFASGSNALSLENAPGACRIERRDPPKLDDASAYALAQIGADQRDLPPELKSLVSNQVNQMIVDCSDGQAVAATQSAAPAVSGAEENAGPTTDETAGKGAGDVVQVQAPEPGLFAKAMGRIYKLQQEFYTKLVNALRSFRADPNAFWILAGLSFAYGIFHAAGPGHGKAIISAYVVANNETLKKGIVLSFISAFAQAVTAVVLVGGLAVVFNLTSLAVQDTARWFEVGSYVLITALGLYLLWQKALRPLLFGGGHGHDHEHHHHEHAHDHDHHVGADGVCSTCGHAHAPTPDMVKGPITLKGAISIVLAVGLRPCSGALIVLVFALSQGMFAGGVFATFTMALGTGITVALLASLAVGAKEIALRLSGEGSRLANGVLKVIEIGGALLVFLLGLTMLIANLGWG